jgi:hypothetical protein
MGVVASVVPGSTIPPDKACDALGVDFLTTHSECGLLASSSSLLLLPDHHMDFFGLDVLSDMPCCQTVLVLLFSESKLGKFETSDAVHAISRNRNKARQCNREGNDLPVLAPQTGSRKSLSS